MNGHWEWRENILWLPALDHRLDVLRDGRGLAATRSGGLAQPGIGDVAQSKQVRVLGVLELQGRTDTNEPVVGVD